MGLFVVALRFAVVTRAAQLRGGVNA
jgi:hypothetical protein